MTDNIGQNSSIWDAWWGGITPLSEIQMWDFYGGRQWILKYISRYGKVIEAGCGLGRYVFYISRLGIDIEGVDFSDVVINKLSAAKGQIEPRATFKKGDILGLPYTDNSISCYVSLGVVEHFVEGPQKAIKEAFRVLRPGGIAIITTPNVSLHVRYKNLKNSIKKIIKKLLGKELSKNPFFQYEYKPSILKKYIENQGLYVSRAESCDLLYPLFKLKWFRGEDSRKDNFIARVALLLEKSFLRNLGGQTITISIKKAPLMYCFLSGKKTATLDSLENYDVPISKEYYGTELAKLYLKKQPVIFSGRYAINRPRLIPELRRCHFSGKEYYTDEIFEDYGFNINVSPDEILNPLINIQLGTKNIKPIWRARG